MRRPAGERLSGEACSGDDRPADGLPRGRPPRGRTAVMGQRCPLRGRTAVGRPPRGRTAVEAALPAVRKDCCGGDAAHCADGLLWATLPAVWANCRGTTAPRANCRNGTTAPRADCRGGDAARPACELAYGRSVPENVCSTGELPWELCARSAGEPSWELCARSAGERLRGCAPEALACGRATGGHF